MHVKEFSHRVFRVISNSGPFCWCYENRTLIVFELKKTAYKPTAPVQNVLFNNRQALEKFDECETWHSKENMLAAFYERLDNGELVATLTEDDCLACYAWLNPEQTHAYFPLVRQQFTFPANCAALYNVYTHISYRGRGLYKRVLNAIVDRAFTATPRETIITAIEQDNEVAIKVNLAMGFRPIARLTYKRLLGKVTIYNERL